MAQAARDLPHDRSHRQPLARAAAAAALPPQPARLVSQERPRPAVAQHRRPVPHPGVGDHAAADAGRSRAAEVPRVARRSTRRSTCSPRRRRRRCRRDVAAARLQHPAAAAAVDRAAGGRATTTASCRAIATTLLSFKGIGEYTAGAIRSFAFRERAAILDTNVARVLFRDLRRQGRSEEPRDEEAAVGGVGGGAAAQARVRLQPGADGFRRDALQRAQAEVPDRVR